MLHQHIFFELHYYYYFIPFIFLLSKAKPVGPPAPGSRSPGTRPPLHSSFLRPAAAGTAAAERFAVGAAAPVGQTLSSDYERVRQDFGLESPRFIFEYCSNLHHKNDAGKGSREHIRHVQGKQRLRSIQKKRSDLDTQRPYPPTAIWHEKFI